MTNLSPTAACWTPPGRGAIAVIRVQDAPLDWSAAARPVFQSNGGRPWQELPVNRLIYGRWGWTAPEDVVVCRLSATDFEVHCHGGDAAVARILSDLETLGVTTVTAEQQYAARVGAIVAELDAAVTKALTLRTADWLLQQTGSRWPDALQRLTTLSPSTAREQIDEWLSWSEFARHLTEPWNVVLTGRPNVGKSSLINALLGYHRAIVTSQPGTTRDVVTAVTAFDGWPVRLSDTAGLRTTTDELEAAGIERARQHTAVADAVLVLLDVHTPPTEDDFALLAAHPQAIIVAHKCDLPDAWGEQLPPLALPVSSITGTGLVDLQIALVRKLIPRIPPVEALLPVTATLRALLQR
ncbi:MAG: GTPase [Planctomycetaceae bacterium]|nr:GTPase [Planctomycetaceae bacterium]